MKVKTYLLRSAIALTTFMLGVNSFSRGETAEPRIQNYIVVQPTLESEIPVPTIIEESLKANSDLPEDENYEFSAEGSYYVFSYGSKIDNLPKPFKDFNEISITTADYTNSSEKNNYQGVSIPPEGYVSANREYKFVRVNIANRQIAFETEKIKGISYKFVGEFTDYLKSPDADFDLQGNLIKMRNGKKIAETKVRLMADGC